MEEADKKIAEVDQRISEAKEDKKIAERASRRKDREINTLED